MLVKLDRLVGHDRWRRGKGIFRALVQTADIVAAVSLLVDFEKCADKTFRRQILDGETDGLRGLRKSLVTKRLTAPRPPSGWKQLGGGVVVEFGHLGTLQERSSVI